MRSACTYAAVIALAWVGCSSDDDTGSVLNAQGGAGGSSTETGMVTSSGGQGGTAGSTGTFGTGGQPPVGPEQFSELWYAVDQQLVHISIDAADPSTITFQSSAMEGGFELGQNAITMLDDGSILGARLSQADDQTYLYHIAAPPRDGSAVTPTQLGVMPDGIMLEGLYTDCDGRVYGMDTGVDDVSADGNRLLRFTGNVAGGDFAFVVVSDLGTADVADIDDMSPGISQNEITDNPGLAIDTGTLYAFDYETGSGSQVATGGSYGMHALGGSLFGDGTSRLYVLSSDAELFEVDPNNFVLSPVLGTGPTPPEGVAGWSGLAGPLTDCESGFTPPQ